MTNDQIKKTVADAMGASCPPDLRREVDQWEAEGGRTYTAEERAEFKAKALAGGKVNGDRHQAAPIASHEGSKYLRTIRSAEYADQKIRVDVYAVLEAFNVTCPARQQMVKKLLCTGLRGKGSQIEDLWGVYAALMRSIEMQTAREAEAAKFGD